MSDDSSQPRLVPARPSAPSPDESAAYMPRLPWRWILLGTLSVATVATGYWLKERNKASDLRSQIVRVHEEQLQEPARRYRAFRDKLESWILEAGAAGEPKTVVDRRLRIEGLRAGRGLYLRLGKRYVEDRKGIEKGARSMTGDSIMACLGLSPASARAIWEKGAFLMPEWIDKAREADGVMDLRVTDEMLARHLRADLPTVLNLIRADWFLLVIEQGDNRRDHPVDVFLWDVRSGQQLLGARVQSAGVLMSARIRSKGAPASPRLPTDRMAGGGANDCSIAAKIKNLAGRPLAEVENVAPPAVDAGAGSLADAASD